MSEDMLRFVQESLYPTKIPQFELDFYRTMEQKLEEKRDRLLLRLACNLLWKALSADFMEREKSICEKLLPRA